MQSHQQTAGVADAGELQRIESELATEEASLDALSGRRDGLMQRRAAALADKQRCGERCAASQHFDLGPMACFACMLTSPQEGAMFSC